MHAAPAAADEVRHYKHFHAWYLRYREQERLSWPRALWSLLRRVVELRESDAAIALRHAAVNRLSWRVSPEAIGALTQRIFTAVSVNYPTELAVRMSLKPLQLGPRLQRMAERPLAMLARRVLLR